MCPDRNGTDLRQSRSRKSSKFTCWSYQTLSLTYIPSNKRFNLDVIVVENLTMFHQSVEAIRKLFGGFDIQFLQKDISFFLNGI